MKLIIILISLIFEFVTCPMAKNIYADPDLSGTNRKFNGFLMDFKGVKTPFSTYWSLCNWQMDLTNLKKKYSDASGGGAYGGLQTVINGKTQIISFWEISYTENGVSKKLRANRVYPYGSESSFGGEGEGNNYIAPFEWETGNWYRYCLRSWDDAKTGNTFVGQWTQDLSTGKWNLFSYFNTKLQESYFTGDMSMFQENYNQAYFGQERKFNIKNTYVRDLTKGDWISLPSKTVSYDPASWGFDTSGTHEFGATEEFFWGSTGLPVGDQKAYDLKNPSSLKLTINQPTQPVVFNGIKISSLIAKPIENKFVINWEINAFGSPMLSYTITITDSKGKSFFSYTSTRPEERTYTYIPSTPLTGKNIFKLEVISIFDEKSSLTVSTIT